MSRTARGKPVKSLVAAVSFFVLTVACFAQNPVRFGIVLDGPSEQNKHILSTFQTEIREVLEGEFEPSFSPEKILTADWTATGASAELDRLLSDSQVDMVLVLGVIASNEVARRSTLSRPVFAAMALQPDLMGLPLEVRQVESGAPGDFESIRVSGVRNLNYVTLGGDISAQVRAFREVAPFSRLTVLLLDAWRQLGLDVQTLLENELAAFHLSRITIVDVGASVQDVLARLPEDAEAVFVTQLPRLGRAEFQELVQGLIVRRLPSFSAGGEVEVEAGLLATLGPGDDSVRLARRVALNVQQVLQGKNPGELSVDYRREERLVINMATARAIGASPTYRTLLDANLLNQEVDAGVRALSLSAVVLEASRVNLDLAAADRTVAAGQEAVREAKSALLPQFNLFGSVTQIDADRAYSLFPENRLGVGIGGSQLIYSDRAWAGFGIEKSLQRVRLEERAELRLDVILQGAQAYLNLLRSKTVERIQRANLELTRTNLYVARSRVEIGVAGRDEVFRWESQIAANQKSVLDAQAARNQAIIEVNRVLNRPLEEQFTTVEESLDSPEIVSGFNDLRPYLDNPLGFGVFRDFMAGEAETASPELRQLDAGIVAKERELTAAKRRFFLPDVSFGGEIFGRRDHPLGPGLGIPRGNDWDWTVQIRADYPLFEGTARYAREARAREELQELNLRRQSIGQRIEQRIRSVLESTNASFLGIELAQNAAEAARRNLNLVSDSYAAGVVDILRLLDAQNFALEADLGAANAIYDYLLDLMEAQRAVGRFDYYRSPQERQEFLSELAAFYARSGRAVRP